MYNRDDRRRKQHRSDTIQQLIKIEMRVRWELYNNCEDKVPANAFRSCSQSSEGEGTVDGTLSVAIVVDSRLLFLLFSRSVWSVPNNRSNKYHTRHAGITLFMLMTPSVFKYFEGIRARSTPWVWANSLQLNYI